MKGKTKKGTKRKDRKTRTRRARASTEFNNDARLSLSRFLASLLIGYTTHDSCALDRATERQRANSCWGGTKTRKRARQKSYLVGDARFNPLPLLVVVFLAVSLSLPFSGAREVQQSIYVQLLVGEHSKRVLGEKTRRKGGETRRGMWLKRQSRNRGPVPSFSLPFS